MNHEIFQKYLKLRESQAYDDSCGLVVLKILCNQLGVETNLSNIKHSFGFNESYRRFPSYHAQQGEFLLERGQKCEIIFFSGEKVVLDNLGDPDKNILQQNLNLNSDRSLLRVVLASSL